MTHRTLALALAVTVAASAAPVPAQFENLGTVTFPTSGSPEAQNHFLRGVALLHSFGWNQAIEQFQLAQKAQPDFAMAYWGETLCYNHPLFAEQQVAKPREVLRRLGPTPEGRLAKAPTEREKAFLGAVEVLWGEGDDHARRLGYMEKMRELYDRHPGDAEVATFYALSMLMAAQAPGDHSLKLMMQAGAIALNVFAERPNHPGAAHYIIHAFDDPFHAPLALPAAERFAEIAGAVSHARHMPSHIFIPLGMWERVAKQNDVAFGVAQDLWQPGDSASDMMHALDWGQYAYLQLGDYDRARQMIETAAEVVERPGVDRTRYSLMKSRYIVEAEAWNVGPVAPNAAPDEIFVIGLSAAKMGNVMMVEQAIANLRAIAEKEGWAPTEAGHAAHGSPPIVSDRARLLMVMHAELSALVKLARGDKEGALTLLTEATQIENAIAALNGPADPVKPSYELLGEVLLDIGRPTDAVKAFETMLVWAPNRPRALLGLARAYARSGERVRAAAHYRRLAKIWTGRTTLPGYREALAFLGTTN
jgi:tetratricopeptide (TPR) repeat protein